MASSCVGVGQLASQYGIVWAIGMWWLAWFFFLCPPSFAREHAFSFLVIHVCTLTLWMMILHVVQYIWCTIAAMSS